MPCHYDILLIGCISVYVFCADPSQALGYAALAPIPLFVLGHPSPIQVKDVTREVFYSVYSIFSLSRP